MSLTGSFDHSVRRNSCAFSLQVLALPLSETRLPKPGLASTLSHGIGVIAPGAVVTDVLAAIGREAAEAVVELQVVARG